MERATVMKTFHGNMTPKSPTLRDRDASFSSYLRPDKPISCQPHHTIESGRCRALDDSTTELSIFDAHKYFNEVTNHDIQKVTISSNSRVSPLVNMDMERNPERGEVTETRRYSSASSSVDGNANIRNYRARSFHAATPTASSEASWNSQAGLLSRPPGVIPVSMMRNPLNPTDFNKKIRASLSKPIWLLRRKCPCTGKKSVEVKEKTPPEPKTPIPPTPPPPQIARDSMNLKRHELDINTKTPIDKIAMPMETASKKPENPNKNPVITPNNWVDQRTHHQDHATTFVAKSQRFQPAENQVSAILQPQQRVLTSVRVPLTEGFTFPVLNPHSASASTSASATTLEDTIPSRDSLEVYRPPIDTSRQNFPYPQSPKSRTLEDDAASDASSDLFEIESFSTQTTSTYPMIYRRRDSLDEASNFDPKRLSTAAATNASVNSGFLFGRRNMEDGSMTPTITECCYEPSEASIDWSVTTAEGYYDRASLTNDDASSTVQQGHGGDTEEKWKRKGSSSSGNGGLLLSCRCEKAVSVGPQPVKCEGQRGTTAALTSRHVSSRVGGTLSVNKASLAESNTSPVSLAFAT